MTIPTKKLEPAVGFEPTTDGLQNRCSASNLQSGPPMLAIGAGVCPQRVMMETFFRAFQNETFFSRRLRPASKKYRAETLLYIKRTWPGIESLDPTTITPLECLKWSGSLEYSAPRFNAMIGTLKRIFRMAVRAGMLQASPADCLEWMPVAINPPVLPPHETFKQVIAAMEESPWANKSVPLVKFLTYSGLRISEARKLTAADLTEYGIRVSDAKNGETAFVPILPEMRELIKELPSKGPLFKIKNPRTAFQNACRKIGVKPLTNHQLRHIFATRCIECGVDIKTVSAWLRHKDGGALALRRYSHVRDEHSLKMAQLVSF